MADKTTLSLTEDQLMILREALGEWIDTRLEDVQPDGDFSDKDKKDLNTIWDAIGRNMD